MLTFNNQVFLGVAPSRMGPAHWLIFIPESNLVPANTPLGLVTKMAGAPIHGKKLHVNGAHTCGFTHEFIREWNPWKTKTGQSAAGYRWYFLGTITPEIGIECSGPQGTLGQWLVIPAQESSASNMDVVEQMALSVIPPGSTVRGQLQGDCQSWVLEFVQALLKGNILPSMGMVSAATIVASLLE